jgi:AAA+ superfamily predicted ATPase
MMSTPAYADASAHLFDYLERASWLLGGERVAVERLVERDALIAAREAASAAKLPLVGLRARAGLDLPSTHVLVMASVIGLDVVLGEQLVERIAGNTPTVQELITMLSFSSEDEGVLLAAFAPDAPLRSFGLVQLGNDRMPLLHRTVHVDDRLVSFLRGIDALDPELRDYATLDASAPQSENAEAIARLLATSGPILVEGPARVGKTSAVIAAAATTGRRTLVGDMERILAEEDPLFVLERLRREAMLVDAVYVLRAASVDLPPAMARRLVDYVQRGVVIVTVRDGELLSRALRGPRRIRIENPSTAEQQQIWRTTLGSDIDTLRVCERYPLPPGDIVLAAAAARASVEVQGRSIDEADLFTAARGRLAHRLGDVAELVSTSLQWSDLVVREEVETRLVEIVAAVRYRNQVMDDWGFSAKLPYGRSLSVLFSGAPGTGKTMVATLIGKELGLEIFRVDLSKIVSKYVGETEKNLARVFEEASRCHAVILFDEADSLFAKRTEVKSSNDRYANLEVNFLLQRLEAHDGIVILTTNAASSIDTAFLRRIRYRVEFPEPDEHERKGLWRSMVPVQTPLASDVDFAALGRKFRLTGGHIKNAVVRAAFLAAAEGTPSITQALLMRAAQLEWTELGNLPGV